MLCALQCGPVLEPCLNSCLFCMMVNIIHSACEQCWLFDIIGSLLTRFRLRGLDDSVRAAECCGDAGYTAQFREIHCYRASRVTKKVPKNHTKFEKNQNFNGYIC